ncbi:osmoprotectant transport system permease protein [Herbihabitans rhizosphaerae]|uniref:Osmoprotectant transport system permease protein n=1 Tax=Herbihabitans rhizosphaerae TaxID=1872711 RepID=A0A4Q7KCG7_9PSEU|nr:ABC transporter permease [Herbihabitans rhizosphaerae]RZS30356.1 osmoprotectant transport system permease protein [Herbihabitans rhizosphaerae]
MSGDPVTGQVLPERGRYHGAALTVAGRLAANWRALVLRPVIVALAMLVLYLVVNSQTLDPIEARTLTMSAILTELREHIVLSGVSAVLTVAIAIPLGIALTRPHLRWLRPIGLGLGNLGQAIPSIGLIVLLALVIGIGFWTAVIALVAYSALSVLRNTIAGLEAVDRTVIESAHGMGMSRLGVLFRVELPLSVPVILAGVRTALVLTVASAVLGTFIDAGGLGGGLVVGLSLNRPLVSITYGVIVAALALLVDWLALIIEEVLRPHGI